MSSSSQTPEASASRPRNNAVTASVPADWTPDPAELETTPFAAAVDHVLQLTAELARNLIGAHQGAATLLIAGDWKGARKWFSLSSKYAEWFDYRAAAVGFGALHQDQRIGQPLSQIPDIALAFRSRPRKHPQLP